MRLDKFLAENTGLTRSQANKVLKQSAVTVNGIVEKNGAQKVNQTDEICLDGEHLPWVSAGQYLMLYKPQGYVCSHEEGIIQRFINSLIIRWQVNCIVLDD